MRVIKPREITGKILTLIEESEDEVTIVSPYINISRWTKVQQALIRAKKRGVRIIVYLREDQAESLRMIEPYADSIFLVYRLHAKLYLNSKSAVFTSMNLVKASDEKSTDLGIHTTDHSMLKSFVEFIDTYLKPNSYQVNHNLNKDSAESEPDFLDLLGKALQEETPESTWTSTNTYWFSSNASPKGDLMISETFTWKLYKKEDITSDIDWFKEVVHDFYGDKVSISIKNEHKKYAYLKVIPRNENNAIQVLTGLLKILRSN